MISAAPGRRWLSIAIPLFCPDQRYLLAITAELADAAGHLLEVVLSHDQPCKGPSKAEILKSFAALEDLGVPVSYRCNSPARGMVENWNQAVLGARGDYVVNLGQDDVLPSEVIEKVAHYIATTPQAVFLATGRRLIDEDGKAIKSSQRSHDRRFVFEEGFAYQLEFHTSVDLVLRNGQMLGEPCCVFLATASVRRAGGYSTSYRHAADVELLVRLLRQGDAMMYPALKSQRRIHSGNATADHIRGGIASADRWQMFEQYGSDAAPDRIGDYQAYLLMHDAVDALRSCRHGHPFVGARVVMRSVARAQRVPFVALGRLLASLVLRVNPDRRLARTMRRSGEFQAT